MREWHNQQGKRGWYIYFEEALKIETLNDFQDEIDHPMNVFP
jgi:hypothetical protein